MFEIASMLDEYWIVGAITAIVVVIGVLIHYEGLRFLSDRLRIPRHRQRRRIVVIILSLLTLHIIEIWVFGSAYYLLLQTDQFGEFVGMATVSLFDAVYYSATVYTTIGFGDITPDGPIRTLTGTEGITGLTLITWSASFTYLEMTKTWNNND